MSRGNPTQPPLDLRLLSHSSSVQHNSFQTNNHQQQNHSREKLLAGSDEFLSERKVSNKAAKKDDTLPDWNLMNVKRSKEKDTQKGLKIPDWSAEEERRFRIDTESKDTPVLKRVVDPLNFESTTNNVSGSKKRGKRGQSIHESTTEAYIPSADIQIAENKNSPISKSSPSTNRKGKYKEDVSRQLADNEVHSESNKRKQSASSNNGGTSNHNNFKKFDSNASQKAHYSEEETSSTTTESSLQEDNTSYKVSFFKRLVQLNLN